MHAARKENAMTGVRLLRDGRVTLPAEVRRKLKLVEGDYLDAEPAKAVLCG